METTLVCHIEGAAGLGAAATKELQGGQLTIGRGSECDWVLPDPDRALSKQHCLISRTPGGFVLTDTSTNGVFMDGARLPVGRGSIVPLSDGQAMSLGPYRIRVAIQSEADPVLPALPPALDLGPEAWIGSVPQAGFGHARAPMRPAWDAPPDPRAMGASGLMAPDGPEPLSDLSQQSEAASPLATVMRVPAAKAVLPVDWNTAPLDAAELCNPLEKPRPAAPAPTPVDTGLVDAFVAGAGLPPGLLDGADARAAFGEFGRMLRSAVLGLRDLLATRKLAKAELRVTGTAVKASGNNALKLSPDAERALLAIAGQPLPGFLPGADAIEEGMHDVKTHELALVAAMSLLLNEIASELAPDAIKAKVGGGWDLLSATKRARCWDRYEEAFAGLAGGSGAGLSLMSRFATMYADQVSQTTGAPGRAARS